MMERTRRWKERSIFRPNLVLIAMGLLYIQGYAESVSRMQNSKPIFNEITPSPEFSMSTDGWRPILPPSTITPPKREEERKTDLPPPKTKNGPNRLPEEKRPITLEDLSPPPMDIIADSQLAGDNESQMRLRRNKKRPPFKTVEPPVVVSSASEALAFRVNSEPHFVRHFPELQDPRFRHRPIETNSGAIYRAVPLLDHAPSQEMLPPTAPSRPLPQHPEGQHLRIRPQQASFITPHIIFHGQLPLPAQHQQQQRFPAVAQTAEPLPGSLLRPHADRAQLTDSTAFRTGGVGFHHRPALVQWQNPLMDGRPSFTVTSTPLVDDNPWPSMTHHDKRPEMTGVTNFPHKKEPQRIRGSSEGKPIKEDPQTLATTVLIPDIPKNPFLTGSSSKGKVKPQREPVNTQFHTQNVGEQEQRVVLIAHSIKHQHPSNPAVRDPIVNVRPSKPSAPESGFPSRSTKKPFRENNEGKPVDQGFGSSESQEHMSIKENVRTEPAIPEPQRDERPRTPGQSKHRQNPNYRKRPEEVTTEPSAQVDHFKPVLPPSRDKFTPTGEGATSQRGQGFRVRKRRPKPKPQVQESHFSRPAEVEAVQRPQTYQQHFFQQQDNLQNDQQGENPFIQQQQQGFHHQQDFIQQQDVGQSSQAIPQQQDVQSKPEKIAEQLEEPQQPQEVQHQRKRQRRPTRIRKPIKESTTDTPVQKEENHLLPTGPAAVQEEQQPQRHKFREHRPRPGLRIRRPRPEVSPSPLPIQNSATAPEDDSYVKDEIPAEKPKKVRVRLPTRQETKEIYDDRERDQFPSSAIGGPTGPYFVQNQEIRIPEKFQHSRENEQVFRDDGFRGIQEIPPTQVGGDEIVALEEGVKVFEFTTEAIAVTEEAAQVVQEAETTPAPTIPEPLETSTASTTPEAPVLSTTEAPTTTVAPTSSAYGIRSRLRTGSRPRFSVKDYRERLNRLSQLSGRGKNSTESTSDTEDAGATGSGVGPTAPSRERWFPGRRQQQTLQEQQQLNHQRLQAHRNDGETSTERGKSESRDRFRPRAPALRPRPVTEDDKKNSDLKDKVETTTTTASSRYRSRFGGRYSTTTHSVSETDVATTENPTSRRRGILTTYGMRRPYPLKLRSGVKTTTDASDILPETTPMTSSPETITTTTQATTEVPTTTTTAATTTTTTVATTEINIPTVIENEVTERASLIESAPRVIESQEPATQVLEVLELHPGMTPQDELMKIRKDNPVFESGSEEDDSEEDRISPEQRVSDLTLWATTGNNGGLKSHGQNKAGLVTFSAVPSAFSSRFVTMATEDPVLPLEAFFFGAPSSSVRGQN